MFYVPIRACLPKLVTQINLLCTIPYWNISFYCSKLLLTFLKYTAHCSNKEQVQVEEGFFSQNSEVFYCILYNKTT